ncbi:MAG: hypothetical protein IPP77_04775 [Bacteroidetes bacterium]|nr:hypothetical protein [Bacteroidota bacterium]
MKKSFRLLVLLIAPAALLFFSQCKKDLLGDGKISFSTDTLTFDTVFVASGSTTRNFKVINNTRSTITIDEIRLLHLVGTQFRINVDAVTGDRFTNVEIAPRDSAYIFVEVTVNPNSSATPFVIIDDVQFLIDGAVKTVHLQAWGQNAHYHYGDEIKTDATWANDLPHIIVSRDTVPGAYVRCGAKLTIQPGCQIFFGDNAAIFVEGELHAVSNSWTDSIVFRGVRLENYYDNKPGQWFGIVFLRNKADCGSQIPKGFFDHCVVDGSTNGIYAGAGLSNDLADYISPNPRPVVNIKNTIVKNSLNHAIFGFNADIKAENSIFFASGDYLINLGLGGKYDFTHCTMYNSGSKYVNHQKEVLLLSNFAVDGRTMVTYPEKLNSSFTNCVVYGNLKNEISFNNYKPDEFDLTDFDNSFKYCLLKSNADTVGLFSLINEQNLFNEEPRFKEANVDFTPSDSAGYFSPIIDYAPTGLGTDIFGTVRPVSKTNNPNKFDLGAVEAP